jgi:hypothetical protein
MTDNVTDEIVTDESIEELTRKFLREGIPEPDPEPSSEVQVHLPDDRVLRIQEKVWLRFPILAKYNAILVTALVDAGWEGNLPTGEYGVAPWTVAQFIISSEHPRPVQHKYGIPHISMATVWKQAWDDAERERSQFVSGGDIDPAEKIFMGLGMKHASDLKSFEEMM